MIQPGRHSARPVESGQHHSALMVLGCLAIGLATNYVVGAIDLHRQRSRGCMLQMVALDGPLWSLPPTRRPTRAEVAALICEEQAKPPANSKAEAGHFPVWSCGYEAGFPMASWSLVEVEQIASSARAANPSGIPESDLVRIELRLGLSAADSKLLPKNVLLPLYPIGIGLVVNSLAFAALAWGVLLAPSRIRAAVRHRRGQCTTCGYPRGEHDHCPECGMPTTPESPR